MYPKNLRISISLVLITFVFSLMGRSSFTPAISRAEPALGDVTFPQIVLNQYVTGLAQPVHITHAGDGSGRLFVVERAGHIRIIQGGVLQGTDFLNIAGRVLTVGPEEGLLSVAFPPGYTSKGYFYVYYTNLNRDNQVSRFHLTADPNVADPASEELILYINHPTYGNHNGGQLAFGPDGFLYIGTGDGGGGGDPGQNAQNLRVLLGKILRIDVECGGISPVIGPIQAFLPLISTNTLTLMYCIPPDNPFIDTPNTRPEIWAYGVRNPWRFSFDRLTGDLYIGDVGQDSWEEVDFQLSTSQGGENYGWNIMEGMHCYNASTCNQSGKVLPVWEAAHPTAEAVTGGFVYHGTTQTSLLGFYFFADFETGRIWALIDSGGWQNQELLDTAHFISTFGEDQAGELYLADYSSGVIYKVEEAAR